MAEIIISRLADEFRSLLANANTSENDIQRFLENNTEFLETPHLLNHRLNLNSLISKLEVGPWYTDLSYLTKSSMAWRLVLVELEHPTKKLFQETHRHNAFHSDFNNALAQIDTWRDRWASHKAEIVDRIRPLLVPTTMRSNSITPYYALVIGRDDEIRGNDARRQRLQALMEEKNLIVFTYDSLLRTYEEGRGQKKCVISPTATGFRIKHLEAEPGNMFSYVEPQHLEVSKKFEDRLVSLGYDIPSWRNGEFLTFNGKLTRVQTHLAHHTMAATRYTEEAKFTASLS